MKKISLLVPNFMAMVIGIFPKSKPKLFFNFLLSACFVLGIFNFNFAQAVDETTVEELVVNEFIGGGAAQGWNDDDAEWNYTLPFAFNFYGVDYTDIKIGSNGVICLDNTEDCDWYPDPDFTDTYGGQIIAPLGIDLKTNVNPSNDIYITENADNVVIRWDAVEYGSTDQINFEAVLYNNGNVKFNYGDFDADPDVSYGAVVGISKGDGTIYTEAAYHGGAIFHQVQTSAWGSFGIEATFSPQDEEYKVALDSNLEMVFDRNVYKDTGNIVIKKVSDDSIVESIDVNSVNITGWGTDTLIIDPTSDLDYYTACYVNVDATAIKDIADEYYVGITDNSTWNFTSDSLTEVIADIPTDECYEVGSAEASQPANTDLIYSNDDGVTWTYTPVDDGSGNDCNVTNIKLTYLGESHNEGEDLEAEFIGTKSDTLVISEGNGKLILDSAQIGTYTMGSSARDSAWGVATDDSGNIFSVGDFKGTVDFDFTNGIDERTPTGTTAIFITKHNEDNSYGWTRVINTSQYSSYNGPAIDTDAAGNVYVTGHFIDSADFDIEGSGDVRTSTGSSDIFVTKYNVDGSYGWTKIIGGSGASEKSQDIFINDSGDIFITGYFYGTVDFDDTAGVDNHTAHSGAADLFISKYNADGTYGWTRTTGANSSLNEGIGIVVDGDDNVYVTGYFGYPTKTVDLDGTAGVDSYTASGAADAFVTRYNADGSYGWSRIIGGSSASYSDEGRSIAINEFGEIFVSGIFDGTVDFDPTAGVDNLTAVGRDIFIVKYDTDGNYSWVTQGSVVGSGWWGTDLVTYGTDVFITDENVGRIIKYDTSGNLVWTRFVSPGKQGRGIDISDSGIIYTVGGFNSSNANFHTEGGSELYSTTGDYDIYLAKHNVDGDYGFFVDGYVATGTYTTDVNSVGALESWNSLSSSMELPISTTQTYTVKDETCTTTLLTQSSLPLDLSSINVSNTTLCLEVALNTSDDQETPKLDSWIASYIEKSTNSITSITFSTNPASFTATMALAATQLTPTDVNEANFEITFGKAIDGTSLTADDFNITGTMTISNIAEIAPLDGTTFAITGTDMEANTTVSIDLPVDKVQTVGGTLNEASNQVMLTYDTAPTPELSLATTQPNPTEESEGNFVVTFDEAINGATLTKEDFEITGTMTLQNDPVELSPFDGTTFGFSGSGLVANTTITMILPAETVEDLAGNLNVISNQISLTYDIAPTPVLALALSQEAPTVDGEGDFVVTFDEAIYAASLTKEDFEITGTMTLQNDPVEVSPFDGTTFGFSGSGMVANTTITMILPAGMVEDLAGNQNVLSNEISLTYDTDPTPVLALASGQDNPTDTNEGNFVITFDEPINPATLDLSDFETTGIITLSNLTELTPFDDTTFAVSGGNMMANTTIVMSLPAGSVEDLVGNLSVESNEVSLTYNPEPLTPVLEDTSETNTTSVSEGTFTVVFDKPIDPTSLTQDDFVVTGTIELQGDPVQINPFDGTTFSFSGSGMIANEIVTLVLPAGSILDLEGNPNLESNEIVLTYDTVPTPLLSLAEGQENPTDVNEGEFEITFDEAINPATLTKEDFDITGTIELQADPVEITPFDGTTFAFSGSGMVANTTITMILPANAVEDLVGNLNVESNEISLTYEEGGTGTGTVLQPTLSLAPNQKNPTFVNNGEFRLTFNEAIDPATLTQSDLALTGTIIIQGNPVEVTPFDGTSFAFSGSGLVKDETVQISLPANKVKDLEGNDNVVSNTVELVYKVIGSNPPEDQYRPDKKIPEDSFCKVITYQNNLGQEIFLGYKAGRIGEDEFGGGNDELRIKFMGLFREEEEFQAAQGGILSKELFYNLQTEKITKRFMIQDFADIDTVSKDYDVVSKMNSLHLMNGGQTHQFRPRVALDWETLFKTMLQLKQVEMMDLTKADQESNAIWEELQTLIKTGEIRVDSFGNDLDQRRLDQVTTLFLTARKYKLFEEVSELKTSPTKQETHEILEEIFSTKLRFLLPKQESSISRIEFARMFVDGYDKYDKTFTRFNDTMRHLKHKFEEEKAPAPGNKRRLGSSYFRNITDVQTVINARSNRKEVSTGRIYPHTVSAKEWESFQALLNGEKEDKEMKIDYSYGIDGDGSAATGLAGTAINEKTRQQYQGGGIVFNYGSGEQRIETNMFNGNQVVKQYENDWGGYKVLTREFVCPDIDDPIDEQEVTITKENFFNAPNHKVTKRFVINDFADIATGSPDYAVMVKMNSLNLMKSSADHRFRPEDDLGWETLFDSLLKLKQVELKELTLKERADDDVWKGIRDAIELKWAEYQEANPNVLSLERRVLNRKTDIVYTAYQYGLFEEVEELGVAPTRTQVHEVLERVFQAEIGYDLADEETSITRIEFARLFVRQHALVGNRVESLKNALGRLEG